MSSGKKRGASSEHPVSAVGLKQLFKMSDMGLRLAPWEYLHESQVFGVKPMGPEGPVYWVNVIGGAGEVFAINLYRGREGLRGLTVLMGAMFEAEESGEEFDAIEVSMEQCLFQVEFSPKSHIDSWDRKALRKARRSLPTKRGGLVARFLSFLPGYMSWRLENEEAEELAVALKPTLSVLSFLEDDLDFCPDFPSKTVPVFVFSDEDRPDVLWQDTKTLIKDVLSAEEIRPIMHLDEFTIEKYLSLPQGEDTEWELATALGPGLIDNKKDRPFNPIYGMVCETEHGRVIGTEVFQRDDLSDALARLMIQAMDTMGERPSVVRVEESDLSRLLPEWLGKIGIRMKDAPCEACGDAFDALYESMG